MDIFSSIETLPHTHSITIKRLKALEIHTLFDLLNYFPTRYENYSIISPISQLQDGETVTIRGVIEDFKNVYTRRITIQKAIISDTGGKIEAVWYNQPFLSRALRKGLEISVSGPITRFLHTFSIEPKEYEIIVPGKTPIHTGRIVPIYSGKKNLTSRTLRDKIWNMLTTLSENGILAGVTEPFPSDIFAFNSLMDIHKAYMAIHFPATPHDADLARARFAFEEMFTIQLSSTLIKREWKKEKVGLPFTLDETRMKKIATCIAGLPFELTQAQKRSIDETLEDLKKNHPMNRFLQGDVGSGKTVVAAIGAYASFLNGYKSIIMAPTEILAQQHFQTLSQMFEKTKVKVGLQTGSIKMVSPKKKNTSLFDEFDIVVGTQALISEKMKLDSVGLVVIDEQHRFGVAQRSALKEKGVNPHLLTMTATPIPRTVALTIYGELDLSVIDEMPKGRTPIKTYVVPQKKRYDAYIWIKKKIRTEHTQVFIICPLIEESEHETLKSVKAAEKEYDHLKTDVFKDYTLGLLHGKMKPKEKEEIMKQFKNKTIDILVSTSVVEVGIDIPNASIMIIEGAQRFGMAQLHQLRGRVGRGSVQSYCLLFTDATEQTTTERLIFFAKHINGMELSEYDMKLRGPGQLYGLQQHGYTYLKVASFFDYPLIDKTKRAVTYFLDRYRLTEFPELQRKMEKFRIEQV
ncbi:MAG: ATP-dependent DNA helicase RecG, partial [bacterium]|nr:ATP-dependent DNA helicase RecG [bacterium]